MEYLKEVIIIVFSYNFVNKQANTYNGFQNFNLKQIQKIKHWFNKTDE